jgi:DNA-binding NarL/FixJ family response regulator
MTRMNNKSISVGIVDDHTLFRDGLINLLAEYPQITAVFKAKNGKDMQEQFATDNIPDIVLMDINMPVVDGYTATKWIKQHFPLVHILALSMYEDETNIVKMLKAGADGYILKECNAAELVRAITSIIENGVYINEHVSGRLINSIRQPEKNISDHLASKLTDREIEFLTFCCSELTYKEIAEQMKVSHRTVDGYRDALFEKLSLKSRTGLVLFAIKAQLVKI